MLQHVHYIRSPFHCSLGISFPTVGSFNVEVAEVEMLRVIDIMRYSAATAAAITLSTRQVFLAHTQNCQPFNAKR